MDQKLACRVKFSVAVRPTMGTMVVYDQRTSIRIVVADDHAMVRSGFVRLLRNAEGFEVVGEARTGGELVHVVGEVNPDVVITDIEMPEIDGLRATTMLVDQWPALRVIVTSMHEDAHVVRRAIACGAVGYVAKGATAHELYQAVRSVAGGGRFFSSKVLQTLLKVDEPPVEELLTPRQLEVLRLIAAGHSTQEISSELGLSPKTVDVHRANIMERLEVRDIASLTRYALRHGLVAL